MAIPEHFSGSASDRRKFKRAVERAAEQLMGDQVHMVGPPDVGPPKPDPPEPKFKWQDALAVASLVITFAIPETPLLFRIICLLSCVSRAE